MAGRHRVLIVEDDKATVEDLAEVLRSIGCDSQSVDNRQGALEAVRAAPFCLVLLDLQIRASPDAIKGHVEHGHALLRELRRLHSDHRGVAYWLPVVVVSGFAREAPAVLEVMKDGASDVIHKPFKSREVSEKVRRAFEDSGRSTHDRCGGPPLPHGVHADEEVVVSIPGDRFRGRTCVTIGGKQLHLTNSSLKVLLHLMVAHPEHTWVHKVDLGGNAQGGFKGISILRMDLNPALGELSIIENDYHGNYKLAANVRIGECDVTKLVAIGDAKISDLARQLGSPRKANRKV